MQERTSPPSPVITLKNAYLALPWHKRLFFPAPLGTALLNFDEKQPTSEASQAVFDAFNKTWFFQRWFLSYLKVFNKNGINLNSNVMNQHDLLQNNVTQAPTDLYATPWLTSTLARFAATPPGSTLLSLEKNDLGHKTGAELAKALAALPANVTSLRLRENGLGHKTGAELAEVLAALPASVTSLDLRGSRLGDKTDAELAKVLAALPASVTSLDLGNNRLGDKTGAELAKVLAALPASVTSLNLEWNRLRTGAELAKVLAALPASVTSLDLESNGLGDKTGTELAETLAALPASVTSLNLGNNYLNYHKTGAELAEALAALPASVTSLNLRCNGLSDWNGLRTGAELAKVLAALPVSVTSLNLDDNGLSAKKGAELAEALAALPASVTSLNLWDLCRKKSAELALLENCLPHLTSVTLYLSEVLSMMQEQRNALKIIFPNVMTKSIVLLDDQGEALPPTKENVVYTLFGFGVKEPGSLQARCGLFAHQQQVPLYDETGPRLPDALERYVRTFNPN